TMANIIYLACPYSHPEPQVRERRFHYATCAAARLVDEGHMVFSPITHSHPIANIGRGPTSFQFWRDFDFALLRACSELVILCLEGWQESVGVQAEAAEAIRLKMPTRQMYWEVDMGREDGVIRV